MQSDHDEYPLAYPCLLLVFWAIKHLSAHQLYQWGWTLLGTGVVLCVLSFLILAVSGHGMQKHFRLKDKGDMQMMMHQDDGMTMHGMVRELEGKTGDDFDAAFLSMMIEHHQGAIDMANAAFENSGHDEIKELADGIVATQQEEIDRMMEWQDAWGYRQ